MFRVLILLAVPLILLACVKEPEVIPPAAAHPTNAVWLVMVYLDGDNNLESDALKDMNEIEAAACLTNTNIIVVVLFDRNYGYSISDGNWTGTRLYHAIYQNETIDNKIVSLRLSGMGLSGTGDDDELNMGDPATLAAFVDWAGTVYNAQHTFLILWNHGDGWMNDSTFQPLGVCYDDSHGDDFIGNNEFSYALEGKGVDAVGFDACLMTMYETAYELKDCADTLIASADLEPNGGWQYHDWLDRFDTCLTVSNLCRSLVMSYSNTYASSINYYTTLSAIDLTKMDALHIEFEAFVQDLFALTNLWYNPAHSNYPAQFVYTVTNLVERYWEPVEYGYFHADLYDLASNLNLASSPALMSAIADAVICYYKHPLGNIYTGNPRSHGLALYFGSYFRTLNSSSLPVHLYDDYDYTTNSLSAFQTNSLWDDYLYALYQFPHFTWTGVGTNTDVLADRERDYYQIWVTSAGTLDIFLDAPPSCNDYLYLYKDDLFETNRIASSEKMTAGTNQSISNIAVTPGWYLIEVWRYDTSNPSEPYTLVIGGTAGIY
ncbi:MAG: hypothetical protein A2Y33_01050 [Spirochaetes bacterium GWF1_51_8]|nr:MAG: hypothetical protein A2Y33_01050 [Spirochaetes bacterium GWF1_51_8]